MACNLTIGRQEVCKETVGGLRAVYFINFQILPADVTFSNDLITAIVNVDNLYKYELKSNENVFDMGDNEIMHVSDKDKETFINI